MATAITAKTIFNNNEVYYIEQNDCFPSVMTSFYFNVSTSVALVNALYHLKHLNTRELTISGFSGSIYFSNSSFFNPYLERLNIYDASSIYLQTCSTLKSVYFPDASRVDFGSSFYKLENINVPKAEYIGATYGWGSNFVRGVLNSVVAPCTSNIPALSMTRISSAYFPGVTAVGANAFAGCGNLVSATFGNLTTVGASAFLRCVQLSTISFSGAITRFSSYTFGYCENLKSIYINQYTVPSFGTNMFYSTNANLSIYVPTTMVATYKAAAGWSSFSAKIVGYNF